MCTEKQLKVIKSQLDVLEELKDEFESIALAKGRTWVEDSSNEGYLGINQFLANQTQECLRRCYKLIHGSDEDKENQLLTQYLQSSPLYSPCSSFTDEDQKLQEKIKEIMARQEEAINTIKTNQDVQEKQLQLYFTINEETENRNKVKFDGIRQEIDVKANKCNLQFNELTKQIQETNRSVSLIKTQNESLKNEQSESKKIVEISIRKLQEKVQTNDAKFDTILKTQEHRDKEAQHKFDNKIKEFSAGQEVVTNVKCQAESALNGINELGQRLKVLSASVEKINSFENKLNVLERAVKENAQKQVLIEQATSSKIGQLAKDSKPLEITKQNEETNRNISVLNTEIAFLKNELKESKIVVEQIPAIAVNFGELQEKLKSNEAKLRKLLKTQELRGKDVSVLNTQIESVKNEQKENRRYVNQIPAISANLGLLQDKRKSNEANLEKFIKTQELREKYAQQKFDNTIKKTSAEKNAIASLKCQTEKESF